MGDTTVLQAKQKLQELVSQQIPQEDPQQQIDRWNKYQNVLNEIASKCKFGTGITLTRNTKQNYHRFGDGHWMHERLILLILGISISAIFLPIAITAYIVNANIPLTTIPAAVVPGAILIYTAIVILKAIIQCVIPREDLILQCKPKLHIDEMYYAKQIKGYVDVVADPDVVLPQLTLKVPIKWLSRESISSAMEIFKDVKLNDIPDRPTPVSRPVNDFMVEDPMGPPP